MSAFDEQIDALEKRQSFLAAERDIALRKLVRLYRARGAPHDDVRADGCQEVLNGPL